MSCNHYAGGEPHHNSSNSANQAVNACTTPVQLTGMGEIQALEFHSSLTQTSGHEPGTRPPNSRHESLNVIKMKRPEDFQAPTSQISHRATPLACRVDANCLGPQSPVSHASPTSFGPQAYFRVLRRVAIAHTHPSHVIVVADVVGCRPRSRRGIMTLVVSMKSRYHFASGLASPPSPIAR